MNIAVEYLPKRVRIKCTRCRRKLSPKSFELNGVSLECCRQCRLNFLYATLAGHP